MLHVPATELSRSNLDMPSLLEVLARTSSRPRYAFMVLNLIAQVARSDGSAGPLIAKTGALIPLREWLCDALSPMGQRDPRRLSLEQRVRDELAAAGSLPPSRDAAAVMVEDEVRQRVRASGKANISRAVSELVKAGLLRRYYQGYRVDHHNRGAQRQAVYSLTTATKSVLIGSRADSTSIARQAELFS